MHLIRNLLKKINHKWIWPLIIIGGASCLFLILILTGQSAKKAVSAPPKVRVQSIPAKFKQGNPQLTLYGRIETPYTSELRSGISAYVDKIYYHEGESFAKGKILIALDHRDVLYTKEQAAAAVDAVKNQITEENALLERDKRSLEHEKRLLELSQVNMRREQSLLKEKLVSPQRVDALKEVVRRQQVAIEERQYLIDTHPARLKQLQAKYQEAVATLNLAKLDYERAIVKAPFAGRVAKLHVSPGERVEKNSNLIDIYATARLEVRAQIPQDQLSAIQRTLAQGQIIKAVTVINDAPQTLVLNRLAGSVAGGSGGTDGFFIFEQSDPQRAIGETLTITVKLPAVNHVLIIPEKLLYQFNHVYVIRNNRLQRIHVKIIGYQPCGQDNCAIIKTKKIKSGESILATVLSYPVTGMSVEVSKK